MVKRIEKTYSVKNDQIKKSVTFSTEESLSSQSSESGASSYVGLSNKEAWENFGRWLIGKGPLYSPTAESVNSNPYSSNTPVKYGFSDDGTGVGGIGIGFGTGPGTLEIDPLGNGFIDDGTGASSGMIKGIGFGSGFGTLPSGNPFSSHLPSYSSNAPVKYDYDITDPLLSGVIRPGLAIAYTTAEPNDAPVNYYSEVIF